MNEKLTKQKCANACTRFKCNILYPILFGLIVLIVITVVYLFPCDPDLLSIQRRLTKQLWSLFWYRFLWGIFISSFIGAFVLWFVMGKIRGNWDEIRFSAPSSYVIWLGIAERAIFTSAIVMNHPEAIGYWIGIKIATVWNTWREDIIKLKESKRTSTAYIFLLGNALSAILGYLGACIALWKFPL